MRSTGPVVALCDGMIIVHSSGEMTCSAPECDAVTRSRDVFDRHCWFISCAENLGSECPICNTDLNDDKRVG